MLIILFLLTKLMTILCFCGSASAAALASTTSVQAKSVAPLNGRAIQQFCIFYSFWCERTVRFQGHIIQYIWSGLKNLVRPNVVSH